MAADWIKMRNELQSHPKVVRIMSALGTDKFRVIGGLHAVWSIFDTHCADGILPGYTPTALDAIIGWGGFAEAMMKVQWLFFDGQETLTLPEFTEHNGQSAKRRAEDQKRKRNLRRDGSEADEEPPEVPTPSGKSADKKRTRERERLEDIPVVPTGKSAGKRARLIHLTAEDLAEEDIDRDVAAEWLQARKVKLTPRAWEGIKKEAASIGWTPSQAVQKMNVRGWRSFEASWVLKDLGTTNPAGKLHNKQAQIEQSNFDTARNWAQQGDLPDNENPGQS